MLNIRKWTDEIKACFFERPDLNNEDKYINNFKIWKKLELLNNIKWNF